MLLALFVAICALGGAAILGFILLWVDKTEEDLKLPAVAPPASSSALERAGALMLVAVAFQFGVSGVSDYPPPKVLLLAAIMTAAGIVAMIDRARWLVTAILALILLSNVILLFAGVFAIRSFAVTQLAFAPFSLTTLCLLSMALLTVLRKKEQLAKTGTA
jgi:hypothetical protein